MIVRILALQIIFISLVFSSNLNRHFYFSYHSMSMSVDISELKKDNLYLGVDFTHYSENQNDEIITKEFQSSIYLLGNLYRHKLFLDFNIGNSYKVENNYLISSKLFFSYRRFSTTGVKTTYYFNSDKNRADLNIFIGLTF